MNLPILNQLRETESTYITFSKALVDFDKAISSGNPCYFTKFVALNLPNWQSPNFFINLSTIVNSGILINDSPNLVFPKAIQFYMENIIRQSIGLNDIEIEEVVEIAFWKMLHKMGLNSTSYKQTVSFINTIASSNFVTTDNNNGWNEIICQIPNKCKLLVPAWKTITNVKNVVQATDTDVCMFDNGNKQFDFIGYKDVIDFNNCVFNEAAVQSFDFNTLLLFYTDETGINKLHGINFIYPFKNELTYYNLPKFTQKTNINNTIGYQFKFNQKSCNNEATQIAVYAQDDHTHWNSFSNTLGKLNSFLEIKMRETPTIIV